MQATRSTLSALLLLLAIALAWSSASPALAGQQGYGQQGYGQTRQDETTGYLDEGMFMGTDPQTGDNVYQIGARPRPQQAAPAVVGPSVIVPEIRPRVRSGQLGGQ